MKNQLLVGYLRVFKKIQVRVESGPRKTLPENACITSEVIHRHKVWNMYLRQRKIFHGHRIFSAFLSCDEFQINQYCL